MLNGAQITITGYVATQPVTKLLGSGKKTVTMRVGWTPRWQDRVTGEWVDGTTSYVTVNCWRKLADNVGICVRKGEPVVIVGRVSVRPFEKDGVRRIAVDVDADLVGHDLNRGVASFQRVRPKTGMTASEFAALSGEAEHASANGGPLAGGPDDLHNGAVTGDDTPTWGRSGEAGIPLPEEPDEDFFDESEPAEPAALPEAVAAPF
jgi:single-strand DNA-binding protein